jgi:methylaspartate ammonia-lyase
MSSLRITQVLFAPGRGGFFYDDQAAIVSGAVGDGFLYRGSPQTLGFTDVRMPAQMLSVGLVLSDGVVVWGDMMSVQYCGAAGRDPVFSAASAERFARAHLVPRLTGLDVSSFRSACASTFVAVEGKPLPAAIEYGLSQALLRAAAQNACKTMAQVLCHEFELPLPTAAVPIYAQSGEARQINVDKMILKRVDVLPHGLINSFAAFGRRGETFREFVRWTARRIQELAPAGYNPTLHFDVYGWIGREIGLDPALIADFICSVADDVRGFKLNIECPADFGSLEGQVQGYAAIVSAIRSRRADVKVVVDERCNTLAEIELFARTRATDLIQIKIPDVGSLEKSATAVLVCKSHGVGAYVGGSCTETDLSARASVHVAVATQADMMLAKPGMGVDEALCIVGNEQNRLLAQLSLSDALVRP